MRSLNSLSLGHLRRRARFCDEPLTVRFRRNWNGIAWNDGFIVSDVRSNFYVAGPLDKEGLHEFLVEYLAEEVAQ